MKKMYGFKKGATPGKIEATLKENCWFPEKIRANPKGKNLLPEGANSFL